MQEKNQTKRIMQLTIVGGLFLFILYRSYHADNIFAVFFYSILSVLEIFLLSNVIPEDCNNFKKNRKIQTLIPTFLAFIIIFLNLGLYLYYENLQNSKTYIQANGNGLHIDLKEDGKYIIRSGSWGGRISYYGNYKTEYGIIHLDKNKFGKINISGAFKQGKIYIDKEKSTKNVLFETERNKIIEHTNYFYFLETK
ncbi:hypothetical protein [Flavobacterium reichenbachii]|uniref:Uncharacterized protein n=1 Tax=Flavobacterium reichenbachii TaxID=362418 RepID=A0A085ZN26_9FLAO|nr:hypothetical protein [Flavobacterium reichenbachii]KFF05840.1 hypothetical protein IW19_10035 [Flavobacterium reichenbachii]OXB12725.1 hypothetical protein B0A68_18225 [Flavobacterium reichenbachii]